jgi:hypothetical protein
MSTFEKFIAILHPVFILYLDSETRKDLRKSCNSIKNWMDYYTIVPEKVISFGKKTPWLHQGGYCNQWVKASVGEFVPRPDTFNFQLSRGMTYKYEYRMIFVTNWVVEKERFYVRGLTVEPAVVSQVDHLEKRSEWCLNSYLIDPDKPIALFSSDSWPVPKFYRLGKDQWYTFGDGGETLISNPCWKQNRLQISSKKQLEYKNHFLQMDKEIQDIQSSGVVHDIIDPNLYPRYYPDNSPGAIRDRIRERLLFQQRDYILSQNRNYIPGDLSMMVSSAKIPIREKYHWVPSDVRIHSNSRVEFLSRINGVDDRYQAKTIKICEEIFSSMLPLFSQAGVVEIGIEKSLQIVVKVQKYELPPKSNYTGKWHVEGLTENIIFAGVYYISHDSVLEGGELKFRNTGVPDGRYYQFAEDCRRDHNCKISSDTAVVFSNILPHRMRTLKNETLLPACRMFINFFVISPDHPVPSTVSFKHCMGEEEAKRRREEQRQQMSVPSFKSGFASVHWGNAGTLEFVDHVTQGLLDEYTSIHSNSSG